MPDNELVGRAKVEVVADMAPFEQAMAQLPAKGAANAKATMDRIKREMQANSASIARATLQMNNPGGGLEGMKVFYKAQEAIGKFRAENARLQSEMDAVVATATRKAASVAAMAQREAQAVAQAEKAKQAAVVATQQAQAVASGQAVMVGNQLVSIAAKSAAAGQAATQAKGGFQNMGMGVLYASQMIEDAQYGLGAIVNNIPILVMALGGSGGLAGAVSIAAVGINVLSKNWDSLADLWRSDETSKEVKRQKELAAEAEAAAQAFEHEAAAMKGIRGEVTDARKSGAVEASNKVGINQSVAEIAGAMRRGSAFTPGGGPVTEQARQLLTNARMGDRDANSRLDALMTTDPRGGAFSQAYRLHQIRNPTGDDRLDQDAARRAAATSSAMADKAREEAARRAELAESMAGNASPAIRKQALQAFAAGAMPDQDKLAESIAEQFRKSGVASDKVGSLSVETARKLTEGMDRRLTEESMRAGITKSDAARGQILDIGIAARESMANAMRLGMENARPQMREASVMGMAEFNRSLLSIRPKDKDDTDKKQLKQLEDAVKELKGIKESVRNGVPAKLGRP